jgi:broad specificity phosphatase PhoE
VSGSDPRLIVVRHGRTAWNATGRYQGHADRPLDATGRAQAAGLVPVLAPLRPVRIVTSDLRRARDTAAPLARASGLALHPDPGLREVDVGAWEGLTRAEAAERHPDEMAAWERGDDVARGGGETRRAAGVRAADALVAHLAAVPAGAPGRGRRAGRTGRRRRRRTGAASRQRRVGRGPGPGRDPARDQRVSGRT